MLNSFYQNYILKYPKLFFSLILLFSFFMVFFASKLEIDASSETLLLERDKDLDFTREIGKKFTAPDYLVVTYSVEEDLLSDKNINNIKNLSEQLLKVDFVESIMNITNVPLLQSPPRPVGEMLKDMYTLDSKGVDKKLAQKEFLESPIYKENLVSNDFKTTSLLINLKGEPYYFELINNRDHYLELRKQRSLTNKEKVKFEKAKKLLKDYRDKQRVKNHNDIEETRQILSDFQKEHNVKLHLGGTTMIADDMVEFVKYDLKSFGTAIVVLLVIILYVLFREIRWVVLPLFISFISIVITSGFLGLFGWEITVISSNFISLQLIMNISLVIHLVIKYKELHMLYPDNTQDELLKSTVLAMAKPSFFVVITTIAGFSSLVFSKIQPIITFGWMMSLGIVVSLICTFLLFPLTLSLVEKSEKNILMERKRPFTSFIADIALNYKKSILAITVLAVIFSISGATRLNVENSFISYFKESTQIYQGMEVIDQKLGGTTPLDIVITFKDKSSEVEDVKIVKEDSLLEEFSDEFEETKEDKKQYWFTREKVDKIKKVHDYLDSLPEVGKVLSLATVTEVGKVLNEGKELDSFTLSLLYKELPEDYKKMILSPYVNVEANMVRISTRIIDSMPDLKRDLLIKRIDRHVNTLLNEEFEDYRISNLLVIYNNMLQSLFDSQIKTIGVVVAILFLMFLVLFKNLKVAVVAIIANTVPVSVIFGVMGWFNIPLDLMTITIAAISIGIAVDDTIHYIHRFTLELKEGNHFTEAIKNSHRSIGVAMFYTSTVIIIGFSILTLSNFIPTIYFGLLTVLAMFMAILADLLLLPVLLILLHRKGEKDI